MPNIPFLAALAIPASLRSGARQLHGCSADTQVDYEIATDLVAYCAYYIRAARHFMQK